MEEAITARIVGRRKQSLLVVWYLDSLTAAMSYVMGIHRYNLWCLTVDASHYILEPCDSDTDNIDDHIARLIAT